VAVTTPDGSRWRYLYDPIGRRIAKQRLGDDGTIAEQTRFAWDGATLAEQASIGEEASVPGGEARMLAGEARVPDGGARPGRTTTWDYRPGTFSPVAQTERLRPRDAPQQQVDELSMRW